ARRACRPGAHVLVSFPPVGTRPGIESERNELATIADGLGFRLVAFHEGSLRYDSPVFERNALRSAGMPELDSDWRCGDLLTYVCVGDSAAPRPEASRDEGIWEEVQIREVRIKIRQDKRHSLLDPALVSVIPGDVLPSVSRRDPRRTEIDVWTSG